MNRFKLICGVFASPLEDNCINGSDYESDPPRRRGLTGFASRVLLFELGDIVDSTVDNDPVQSSVQWDRLTVAGKSKANNQQSLSLLCLPTSWPLNFCSFGS